MPTDGPPSGGTPSPERSGQLTQQEREDLARALGYYGNKLKRRIKELTARLGEISRQVFCLNERLKNMGFYLRAHNADDRVKRQLAELERERQQLEAELETAYDDFRDVAEDWNKFDLDDVTIRLWDGADGLIVYADVRGSDLFDFEHPGWFYPTHTWTHGSLLLAEGFFGVWKMAGLPLNLFKALKSGRCLDDLADDVARTTSKNAEPNRYWWKGRYSTPASQPGAYQASGGKVFPTRRNSGLSGDALRREQEAFARMRLAEGHPVEVVRGQAREAGLTSLGRNERLADPGAENAIQRALESVGGAKTP